ncbi:hypothetical protein ACHAWF_005648 [Thalassiosira exigua]
MALFLAPMEMAGAVLGVTVQRMLPDWLFLSFAAVVLGITSHKTFRKFVLLYERDNATRKEMSGVRIAEVNNSDVAVEEAAETEGFVEMEEVARHTPTRPPDAKENDQKESTLELEMFYCHRFLDKDARQYPREKIAGLILLWAGLAVITFLKGGNGMGSVVGITCQDTVYYVLVAAQFLWTFGFAATFGQKLVKETQERLAVNYPFLPNDVLWDLPELRFYSIATFLAGVVAGLIGVGGGMVLGPLMVMMGVDPSVSTATTGTMILLTSSTVATTFVASGSLPWVYALYFFGVCFLGAFAGKTRIDLYVKETGMSCILVGSLATIIGLATLGCVVVLVANMSEVDWCLEGFQPFCVVNSADEDECAASRLLRDRETIFFRYLKGKIIP